MPFSFALNTIVYVMIFLFPGIIFRKFLFYGKDAKQFDSGNLLERFLWILLSSIFTIIVSSFLFFFIGNILEFKLLDSISYSSVRDILVPLSDNKFPSEEIISENYIDFSILILAIYVLSFALGIIFRKLNNLFGFIPYKNYWHKVLENNKKYKNSQDLEFGYVQADVLVETNKDTVLYSGRVEDYYLKEDYNLQTIVLSGVVRYKKSINDQGKEEVKIKNVPGNHFAINYERVVNLNFNYIYNKKQQRKHFIIALNIIQIFSLSVIILFPFTDGSLNYTPTVIRKITFIFCGLMVGSVIFDMVRKIIQKEKNIKFKENIYFFIFFIIPFFWIFNFIAWYWVIIIPFALTFLSALFTPKNTQKPNS